ncbi:hypothetical protein [Siminovitchia fortis]|uniref:hypothetical protein n=1 Tax=Siminovitchia fortis TaxID=254758 RepID=UPI0011A652C8|nr:hypothetical protein [Siminovitchia fortis]
MTVRTQFSGKTFQRPVIKKSARRPSIGDKHKTSAEEGVVCLQQRLAYDLEPMAPEAGHYVNLV